MNLLAFDTSTQTLSAAVQRDGRVLAREDAAGGAHASATLVPLLQSLVARACLELAQLDAIVFGRGPGSFTGLRTACAVAQGLGFGAKVPVLGIETLLAVAEDARERHAVTQVVAVLDARMNEVYTARYGYDGAMWHRDGAIVLARPQSVDVPSGWALAGNAFAAYGEQLPRHVPQLEAVPTAAAMLRIAPRLIASGEAHDPAQATPIYIRDKVAQTTEERAAARSIAAPSSSP
jgi:tRNA threonylcarbamoyladenosine biosynthesis protein TsaB